MARINFLFKCIKKEKKLKLCLNEKYVPHSKRAYNYMDEKLVVQNVLAF